MRRKKERENKEIELTYKTKISYVCPKRGLVEEEVRVKRYKGTDSPDDPSALIFKEVETSDEDE